MWFLSNDHFFLKIEKLIINSYGKINKIEEPGNNEKAKDGDTIPMQC